MSEKTPEVLQNKTELTPMGGGERLGPQVRPLTPEEKARYGSQIEASVNSMNVTVHGIVDQEGRYWEGPMGTTRERLPQNGARTASTIIGNEIGRRTKSRREAGKQYERTTRDSVAATERDIRRLLADDIGYGELTGRPTDIFRRLASVVGCTREHLNGFGNAVRAVGDELFGAQQSFSRYPAEDEADRQARRTIESLYGNFSQTLSAEAKNIINSRFLTIQDKAAALRNLVDSIVNTRLNPAPPKQES